MKHAGALEGSATPSKNKAILHFDVLIALIYHEISVATIPRSQARKFWLRLNVADSRSCAHADFGYNSWAKQPLELAGASPEIHHKTLTSLCFTGIAKRLFTILTNVLFLIHHPLPF